jgi:hypothetical protein
VKHDLAAGDRLVYALVALYVPFDHLDRAGEQADVPAPSRGELSSTRRDDPARAGLRRGGSR